MAGFKLKVKTDKEVRNLLKKASKDGLIPKIRKEFSKLGPKNFRVAIQKDILRGVSPVRGKRFAKYSDSYKEQIRGKAGYFTKNGKVIRISSDGGISNKDFTNIAGRNNKGAKKQLNKNRKANKALIAKLNAHITKYGKRVSPRNMKLSGDMLKKLKVFTSGQVFGRYRLVVFWKHKLADIHNRKGAGRSKVIRRLLPTKSNEKFNTRLTNKLLSELKKATNKIVKSFN